MFKRKLPTGNSAGLDSKSVLGSTSGIDFQKQQAEAKEKRAKNERKDSGFDEEYDTETSPNPSSWKQVNPYGSYASINLWFNEEIKSPQRPSYRCDGNRGCLKGVSGNPMEIIATVSESMDVQLKVELISDGWPSRDFHLGVLHYRPSQKIAQEEDKVLMWCNLQPGSNKIRLDMLNVERNKHNSKSKAGKLVKSCLLRCTLMLGDGSHIVTESGTFDCEQDKPPKIMSVFKPHRTNILMIKGKNFQTSKVKGAINVYFSRESCQIKATVIEEMLTSEVIVSEIPGFSKGQRETKIRVEFNNRLSDPYKYLLPADFSGLPDLTEIYGQDLICDTDFSIYDSESMNRIAYPSQALTPDDIKNSPSSDFYGENICDTEFLPFTDYMHGDDCHSGSSFGWIENTTNLTNM